jgi:NAD(P)-dependent dehydrogenase (short-subunit alcohol dehydrogenase family)
MELRGKTVIVTGGAGGIGKALAQRLRQEEVRGLAIADIDGAAAAAVGRELDALGLQCNVTREQDIRRAIDQTRREWGDVDVFCSNAGLIRLDPDRENAASAPDEDFELCWRVHVMAHVYAARALLPAMIARGSGYFLNTVSAAGLLNQIGSATYSTTKHAALGFAESLAITHRNHGIRVSVLCPQAVRTALYGDAPEAAAAAVDGVLSPEEVADAAVAGIRDERFLILPHPQVSEYMRRKATDYERWIAGMARWRQKVMAGAGPD